MRFLALLPPLLLLSAGCSSSRKPIAKSSADCRACHPGFHQRWEQSRHARAMQAFTPELARTLGKASVGNLALTYALGGKNTYYFLTPLDRGRLQVAPLAYDVAQKRWYDLAASGVRPHAPAGTALAWTDPAFTFNTSCYGCHVSQLETNYDASTDTYRTTFAAAGINCRACHGADPHAKPVPHEQSCRPCHAKMTPLSAAYDPGQRFFDHYDLTALEHEDFYPDGRDRGENYTLTGFLRSGCARSGQLQCLTCHASTGALRGKADELCASCHGDVKPHGHHAAGSAGNGCTGCHMPQSTFAAMRRTDHSMRPPTPAATLEYRSPNACNGCHAKESPQWADRQARAWYGERYQEQTLREARWIDEARRRDWRRLPEIAAYLKQQPGRDPILAASLVRLLAGAPDAIVKPVMVERLADAHPLVRAAAAAGLVGMGASSEAARAAGDEYRLVRIRAGAPEMLEAYRARPDDYTNQTNMGNYFLRQQRVPEAIAAFEAALRLRPEAVGTLVNASLAYGRANRLADAERVLRTAVRLAPQSAPAQFNLGLVLAETGKPEEARQALRAALLANPNLAPAAYNLALLTANRDEAIAMIRRAVALAPGEPRYAEALARLTKSKDLDSGPRR